MIIVDANVLLYAVNEDSAQHEPARRWLDTALSGGTTVGFAWVVLLAFVRLSTHPSIFPRPLSPVEALSIVKDWLASPSAQVINPSGRHVDVLESLLVDVGSGGNLVNDAHLAALAVEHRADVATFDRDFGRFDGVRRILPS